MIHAVGAVLPGMVRRRRGRLAAVSSIAGAVALPGSAAYAASKAAVTKLMECLGVDLRGLGIRVTAILPGYVDTAMITDEERATLGDVVARSTPPSRSPGRSSAASGSIGFPAARGGRRRSPSACRLRSMTA